MCVAIVQPVGIKLFPATLEKCFKANGHGGGLAYVKEGEVVIAKGFMTPDKFIEAYEETYEHNKTSPILLHCRIATVGAVNPNNCHPFKVKGGAMIHNGSFWGGYITDVKSDTREFAEKFHNQLGKATVNNAKEALEKAVGYNKIVFLYKDKSVVIINENSGKWVDKCWFSNTFWERY